MKKAILFTLTAGFAFLAKAQLPQISGTIEDFKTGEAIQGAIVFDSAGFNYTYSNRNGYYSMGMGGGKYAFVVSASGYKKQVFYMDVYGPKELNIQLKPLNKVITDTGSNKAISTHDYRSGYTAPLISQVQNMPAPLNEPDPVKFLQFLPGINGGIEGLSGMYARGGNSDQNLVSMDGLTLYGNGHIFGFLSGFNPDQVRDIQFYRGVAPARYGGRAGAVMDVSMLEGNKNAWKGNFWSDLLALKLNMDGPISEKVTASIGIRRSWLDMFLPHSGGNYIFYNLHDINAKVVYRPDANNKLSFWVYNGRDKFGLKLTSTERDSNNRIVSIKLEQSITWQNTLTGVNLAHKFSSRHYANFLVGMSRYSYNSNFGIEGEVTTDTGLDKAKIQFKQNNSITDFVGKADFEYNLLSGSYLRYGAEIIRHGFRPNVERFTVSSSGSSTTDTLYGKINIQGALESSFYGEYETNLTPGLKVNAGGRLWLFAGKDKVFLRPEPRIMLSQQLQGQKALKLAASISNQGINQLASVNASLPGNIWFPASKNFQPQQNIQFTAGYYRPLKAGFEFTLDGYYKIMKGVTDVTGADEGDLLKDYWIKMLAQGKGNAYGLEAMIMRKHGRFNGLVSYTFSQSNRTIPDINFGNKYPFRWDRRHKIALTGVYHVNQNFMVNFAVVIMSGNAVSVPTGKYVAADGTFIYDYSEKNNFRMPFYRRVDLGFSKVIRPDRGRPDKQYWGINIYNMLNQYNPLFINLERGEDRVVRAMGVSYFPFVPSIFYKLEF